MSRRIGFSEADFDRIAELREGGASIDYIGLVFGCSGKAISWHLLRLGIESPKPPKLRPVPTEPAIVRRGRHIVRLFTAAEDEVITAMAVAGHGDSVIARAVGRRTNSIRGRLMTLARREARAELLQ